MVLKHSLNILTSRFSLVYKCLIFITIVVLIFTALSVSALFPTLAPIYREVEEIGLFRHVGEAIKSTFSGDLEVQNQAFHQLKQDYDYVMQVFRDNTKSMIMAVVWIVLLLIVFKFLVTLAHYPTTDIINHFMMSNSRYGFTSNLIANLKKAIKFSAVDTLITIPYAAISIGLLYGIATLCFMFSSFIGLMMLYLFSIIFFSIKRSLFACWLPMYVVEDIGVFASLKKGIIMNKSIFGYNLGMYFMFYVITSSATILLGLTTFGVGLVIGAAINLVLCLIIDMVIYYRKNEKKYYVDPETVINSKKIVNDSF